MTKYKYTGKESKRIIDCTGKPMIVTEGDIFEMKSPINLENIEEVKAKPKQAKTEDKE